MAVASSYKASMMKVKLDKERGQQSTKLAYQVSTSIPRPGVSRKQEESLLRSISDHVFGDTAPWTYATTRSVKQLYGKQAGLRRKAWVPEARSDPMCWDWAHATCKPSQVTGAILTVRDGKAFISQKLAQGLKAARPFKHRGNINNKAQGLGSELQPHVSM